MPLNDAVVDRLPEMASMPCKPRYQMHNQADGRLLEDARYLLSSRFPVAQHALADDFAWTGRVVGQIQSFPDPLAVVDTQSEWFELWDRDGLSIRAESRAIRHRTKKLHSSR